MKKIRIALQLIGYFGIGWLLFRVFYALKTRAGWYRRRFPPYEWADRPLVYWLRPDVPSTAEAYAEWRAAHAAPFFFDALPTLELPQAPIDEADALISGAWTYFTHTRLPIGMPPDWHKNQFDGQRAPEDKHWSRISDFDSGDIKFIWEASRFSGVFALVRAYAATRDEKYPAAFWQLVSDWADKNPPQLGPNWKCGQEATFRVMAWCFGLYAFKDSAAPQQIAQLVSMIAAHGDRIEGNIAYAVSQNNNHGVSEGVGLWTIGTLFPEFKQAKAWARKGKRIAQGEIRRQVYDDGSYAQYSPNYQRVMLHDAIWALRLGELNHDRFAADIYQKVEKSADFLANLLDPTTGYVPNHGANDSAFVLPLNKADSRDFRPIVQLAYYTTHRKRLFDGFDEDLRWLFAAEAGAEAAASAKDTLQHQPAFAAPIGGYYTMRGPESWLMMRCATYKARPHHADQLHVDFWWRGINICCDAGTYLYNGDLPWDGGLSTTTVHNTVSVDGRDQMTPYSHFIWLDWSRGHVERHTAEIFEGWHDGYRRLPSPVDHQRRIERTGDVWLITDTLTGTARHTYTFHWLLPDLPYEQGEMSITLKTEHGDFYLYFFDAIDIVRAESSSVRGWRSQFYGEKEPALSVKAMKTSNGEARLWMVLSPQPIPVNTLKSGLADSHLSISEIAAICGQDQLTTTRSL